LQGRERVLRTITGSGKVDRIPVYLTASGIPPEDLNRKNPSMLRNWVPPNDNLTYLRKQLENLGDLASVVEFDEFDRRFMFIPEKSIKVETVESDGATLKEYLIKTPEGNLSYKEKKEKTVATTWIEDTLLKTKEDAKKILSVPWKVEKEKLDASLRRYKKLMDDEDEWIRYIWISTPMVCISHMYPFETFLKLAYKDKAFVHELISTAHERIYERLHYLLEQDVGDVYRFGGSEQATPPMMSSELYDEYVLKYDRELFDLVHKYDKPVQVHCHGRVRTVLKKMKDMGVDATDPLEPPPQGDVTPIEALDITDGAMTIVGNIEFRDLVRKNRREIKSLTLELLDRTEGRSLILASSDNPISGVSDQMLENYLVMLETVEEFRKGR